MYAIVFEKMAAKEFRRLSKDVRRKVLQKDDVLDFVRELNPDFRREIERRWESRTVDAVGIDELR